MDDSEPFWTPEKPDELGCIIFGPALAHERTRLVSRTLISNVGDRMNAQAIVGLALKASIMMTVFAFGLESGTEDLLYLLRRPRLLIRSLTAMFVVMPLFVLLMTKVVSFNPVVVIALIALSISPVPPLLPKKVNKSGGLAPYGIGLMVTAATLSIGYIPLATYLLGKYFNRPLSMDPGAVAKLVVSSVLIPLAVGIVFRRLAPTTAKRIANPSSPGGWNCAGDWRTVHSRVRSS